MDNTKTWPNLETAYVEGGTGTRRLQEIKDWLSGKDREKRSAEIKDKVELAIRKLEEDTDQALERAIKKLEK